MDARRRTHEHPAMETLMLAATALVFVIAGAVKGVTGMGLPTVAVGLLGLLMPPGVAAALLVVPSLATNVAQCFGAHTAMLVRRLWPAWLMLLLVTVCVPLPSMRADTAGAAAAASPPVDGLRLALGIVLIGYGLWGLSGARLPQPPERSGWLSAGVGALTGLVTAATAVFVMPMAPYLQSMRLPREALVQGLGLSFTVATVALALRLQREAALFDVGAVPMLVALVAAFVGLGLGSRLRGRLGGAGFQRAVQSVFVLLGLAMLLRALG